MVSGFDTRLAQIKDELAGEAAPGPSASGVAPASRPRPQPDRAPREPYAPAPAGPDVLAGLYRSLLETTRTLLDGYEAALARLAGPTPPTSPADPDEVLAEETT